MSDSEDDKPLAARNIVAKQPAVAVKTESASTSPNPLPAPNPQNAIKRKAAQKAPVIDSDSEDDKPLLTRAKPAARQGDHCSPMPTAYTCTVCLQLYKQQALRV